MSTIVKVQISLVTSDGSTRMLIYSKLSSIMYEGLATQDILDVMNGRPKAYFEAELVSDPDNGNKSRIKLIKEVKTQNW